MLWLIASSSRAPLLPPLSCWAFWPTRQRASFQRLVSTALCIFNDPILRIAFERRLTVIDLRLVCNEAADYANPIEPSSRGGGKIAGAILRALQGFEVGSASVLG